MKQTITLRFGIIALLIIIAALSRMLPHPYNFTPLMAISLFGAAHFSNKWQALLIPLLATWLSDLFINNVIYQSPHFIWFYEGFYWQYSTYFMAIIIGFFMLNKVTVSRVVGSSLLTACLFFAVSNFGVWIGSPMYSQDVNGLLACYTAGIPFFGGTLLGNLFFCGALFGVFHVLQHRWDAIKLPLQPN
ncbi:MAG: DUF6580 family putative transport protein [Bacteroidota bacterium]